MRIQSIINPDFLKAQLPDIKPQRFAASFDSLEKTALETTLPLSISRGRPFVSVTASLDEGKKVFKPLIDTGSEDTILSLLKLTGIDFLKRVFNSSFRSPFNASVLSSVSPMGLADTLGQKDIMLRGLEIKSLLLANQTIIEPTIILNELEVNDKLGLDLLKGYRWTLDMKNKRLHLKKLETEGTGNPYLIEAELHDGPSVRLLVDTGSSHCLLSPALQRKMRFPEVGSMRIGTASGETLKVPRILMAFDSLDGYEMERVVAVVSDMPACETVEGTIDGIVGMNVLKHFICEFDPITEEVTLIEHDED